jgi:hypothetical protein
LHFSAGDTAEISGNAALTRQTRPLLAPYQNNARKHIMSIEATSLAGTPDQGGPFLASSSEFTDSEHTSDPVDSEFSMAAIPAPPPNTGCFGDAALESGAAPSSSIPSSAQSAASIPVFADSSPASSVTSSSDCCASDGNNNKGKRPWIKTSNCPLHEKADKALKALQAMNEPPVIFIRSGELTRIRIDCGKPIAEPLCDDALRHRLSQVARFRGRLGDEISPPAEVVKNITSRGEWPFPRLEAVTEVPTIREDGTLCDVAGYDPATRLFYYPAPGIEFPAVPVKPNASEIQSAVSLLQEIFVDVPFDSGASRANAIGLLLTPVLRPAISGSVPCALITAPQKGSGKGKVANAVSLISTGRPLPVMSPVKSADEWRKRITSTLREGATFICFDNLEDRLDNESLAAALTAEIWRDRELGKSSNLELPQRATWAATGNNIMVGGDLARRCYLIRIDTGMAQPWLRTNFRHPDLEKWVRENRSNIIGAALTLARAWFAAGQPKGGNPIIGSFENWSRVIGGVLAHVEIGDFLGNAADLYDSGDQQGAE